MTELIMNTYREISEKTYYNFEIHYLDMVASLGDAFLNLRDILTLVLIDNSKEIITPTFLSQYFHVNMNTISNQLKALENEGYIIREKSIHDMRQANIQLQDKSRLIVNQYRDLVNELILKIRKSFHFVELSKLPGIMKKMAHMTQANQNDHDGLFSAHFLFHLTNYFSKYDHELIEKDQIDMKLKDLFLLTELWVDQQLGLNNLKLFSDRHYIPYQTMVSKIKKYVEVGLLAHKDKKTYEFSPSLEHLILKFVSQRTILHYQTMSLFTTKEEEMIYQMFDVIKQTHLQQKKA